MSKNLNLREKRREFYPPILWIICVLLGLFGAYNSQIGSIYHMTTDAILFISGWLIFIGLFVLFMSYNDSKANQEQEKVGVYSAINHPRLFGQYLLLIGLTFQSINLPIAALILAGLSLYNKWLLNEKLKGLFGHESFFRFNLFNMSDNKRAFYFSASISSTLPFLLFSIIYLVLIIELRNRSIGRSLLDLL